MKKAKRLAIIVCAIAMLMSMVFYHLYLQLQERKLK